MFIFFLFATPIPVYLPYTFSPLPPSPAYYLKQVKFTAPLPSYDLSGQVPLEVPAGTMVLIHGAVLHMSKENTSGKSRHAYSVHVIESSPGHAWAPDNWLQRKEGFAFEPLYDDDGQGTGAGMEGGAAAAAAGG
jgi:hypothetical protein